ncbi:MAG: alpha/beta hydrolase [Candidatus Aenigmarchaeota archaeon]|nr:alpha/beta hydrolase [Candidatus Aenigmarchaeota archaeon]
MPVEKSQYKKTQSIIIKNRKGQNISVLVDKPQNPEGLAIVMHGLGGSKEQPHVAIFAEAFKESGYTVVRFDTTNTFGESDGRYEDATVTNYYEDLEDVIVWAKTQSWYVEPFCLVGHSLGGISIILYAEKHPEEIKGLAPISTVVSGRLSAEAPKHSKTLREWEKSGWREEKSISHPGRIKRLPWSHMVDRLKYDVLPEVNNLTMPVLLIVGEKDGSTPYKHQKLLYDKLPGKKELHVIKNAAHELNTQEPIMEIKRIFLKWIDKI